MRQIVVKQSTTRRRQIGGTLTVQAVAQRLRHFAYLEMRLMEIHAGWVPYIPLAELKVEWGYHIYANACHVDALRTRLPEVGAFDQHMTPANERIVLFLNELGNVTDLFEQLSGLYRVLLPQIIAAYRAYLLQADTVSDHPTVQIIERALADHERVLAWGQALLLDWAEPHELDRAHAWETHLLQVLQWAGCIVGETPFGTVVPHLRDSSDGRRFRMDPPVRDARFRIEPYVRTEGRAATDVWDTDSLITYLFMNVEGEIEATEACCRTLFDFPDIPWELRFQIARQMWDEARHAELSLQRYAELGGTLDRRAVRDTFPLYFNPVQNTDICFRLAHLNQVIEGWVTDDFAMMADIARGLNDERSARLFEYLIADEWAHIKIGSDWIPRLTEHDPAYRQRVIEYRSAAEQSLFSDLDQIAAEVADRRKRGELPTAAVDQLS